MAQTRRVLKLWHHNHPRVWLLNSGHDAHANSLRCHNRHINPRVRLPERSLCHSPGLPIPMLFHPAIPHPQSRWRIRSPLRPARQERRKTDMLLPHRSLQRRIRHDPEPHDRKHSRPHQEVTTNACLFLGYCAGNIAGPFFYLEEQKPTYTFGIWSIVVSHLLEAAIVILLRCLLAWENKRRDRKQAGQSGGKHDPRDEKALDETAFGDLTVCDVVFKSGRRSTSD